MTRKEPPTPNRKMNKRSKKTRKKMTDSIMGKEGKADLSAKTIRKRPGGRVYLGEKKGNDEKRNRNGNERNRKGKDDRK